MPCAIVGTEVTRTGSIGIGSDPKDACEPDALIRCADAAMYLVKSLGRHYACFYAEAMAVRRSA